MLSIIIPTLDEEKVIGKTLSLLKSQLTTANEIIVSDGRSKDKTVEIARKLADKVVVYEGVERQTIAHGRNAGARIAQGDFFVFLDADCVIPEPGSFFASALAHFEKDPHLVAITVYLRVFPDNETVADKLVDWIRNVAIRMENNFFQKGDCPGGEFQMIRKEAFWRIGGYREELVTCEDRDLFRRLAKIGRTMSDPTLTVFHTGRRAHILGWPYLIGVFVVNAIYFRLRGRAFSKEWAPVR